jgi:hypothetical protein
MPGQEDIEYLCEGLKKQCELLKLEDDETRDLLANPELSAKKSKKLFFLDIYLCFLQKKKKKKKTREKHGLNEK